MSNNNYYTRAKCKLVNLYTKLSDSLTDITELNENNYLNYNITLSHIHADNGEITLFPLNIDNKLDWYAHRTDGTCESLGSIIERAFVLREIYPTKNNANSSRSHIIVCITFEKDIKDPITLKIKKQTSKVVICDLAGVEDRFTCKFDELLQLDLNYSTKSDKYKCDIDKSKEKDLMNYDKLHCTNKLHYYNMFHNHDITFDNYLCTNPTYNSSNIIPKQLLISRASYIISMYNIVSIYNHIKKNDNNIYKLIINNYDKILETNICDITYIKNIFINYLNTMINKKLLTYISIDNIYTSVIKSFKDLNKTLIDYIKSKQITYLFSSFIRGIVFILIYYIMKKLI
jgi:hypothetical protein